MCLGLAGRFRSFRYTLIYSPFSTSRVSSSLSACNRPRLPQPGVEERRKGGWGSGDGRTGLRRQRRGKRPGQPEVLLGQGSVAFFSSNNDRIGRAEPSGRGVINRFGSPEHRGE